MGKRIIMLVGKGKSSAIMYNGIKDDFDLEAVIIEESRGLKSLIKRKIKRFGLWHVIGQILFQLSLKGIRLFSTTRINEIKNHFKLSDRPISNNNTTYVSSVNSDKCLSELKRLNPDIILVCGTRIISKKILSNIDAYFINTHIGITPKYRGVHGGYWAAVNSDFKNLGVTIHLIDEGIDTGEILYQNNVDITKKDNVSTYVYLQYAEGIKLLKNAIHDIKKSTLDIKHSSGESKLWFHPTIWQYLYFRIAKGVK